MADRLIRIGMIIAATEMINKALKMLLPRIVPKDRSSCPFNLAIKVVANSGLEVAKAAIVTPITLTGTLSRLDILIAP